MRIRPLLERMLQPDPQDRPDSMLAVAAWVDGAGAVATAATGALARVSIHVF